MLRGLDVLLVLHDTVLAGRLILCTVFYFTVPYGVLLPFHHSHVFPSVHLAHEQSFHVFALSPYCRSLLR